MFSRSLWDWASRIAGDQREPVHVVCANLFGDVITGAIVTAPPLEDSFRQWLSQSGALGRILSNRRLWLFDNPHDAGYWPRQIVIDAMEIDRWLLAHAVAQGNADAARATASEAKIKAAITKVYGRAHDDGTKPPNIKELRRPVQALLQAEGLTASGNRIMSIGSRPEFAKHRGVPGFTISAQRRQPQ